MTARRLPFAGVPIGRGVTPAEARALMAPQRAEAVITDALADAMRRVPQDQDLDDPAAQRFIAGRVAFTLRRFGLIG